MAISITRKDWIYEPKAPTDVHGHFWFMDSSKMELDQGVGSMRLKQGSFSSG